MWVCLLFQSGGECMVLPTLKDEEANELFPKGFYVINLPSGKPYLRITPQPWILRYLDDPSCRCVYTHICRKLKLLELVWEHTCKMRAFICVCSQIVLHIVSVIYMQNLLCNRLKMLSQLGKVCSVFCLLIRCSWEKTVICSRNCWNQRNIMHIVFIHSFMLLNSTFLFIVVYKIDN